MKRNVSKWCNMVSFVLLICFVVKTVMDYGKYSSTLNSAPFEVWILVNAIYLLLPALVIFLVGVFIKKKRES